MSEKPKIVDFKGFHWAFEFRQAIGKWGDALQTKLTEAEKYKELCLQLIRMKDGINTREEAHKYMEGWMLKQKSNLIDQQQKSLCDKNDKIQALEKQVEELKGLLGVARCPNCDGKGAIQITEDDWEQCQWCDEVKQLKK